MSLRICALRARPILLLLPLLSVLIPASSSAQFGVALGEIYPSLEPTDRVAFVRDLPTFESFGFFLVAEVDYGEIGSPDTNLANGITAWEARLEVPVEITVTARNPVPAGSIDVGNGENNWIVGTGILITGDMTPFALVEHSGLLLTEGLTDLVLSVHPSEPSSFDDGSGPGALPGWLEGRGNTECPGIRGCLRPFARWDGRLVINCVLEPECEEVATESATWGSVKSRFD